MNTPIARARGCKGPMTSHIARAREAGEEFFQALKAGKGKHDRPNRAREEAPVVVMTHPIARACARWASGPPPPMRWSQISGRAMVQTMNQTTRNPTRRD